MGVTCATSLRGTEQTLTLSRYGKTAPSTRTRFLQRETAVLQM